MVKTGEADKMNLRNFQIVRDSLSHPIEVHSIFVDVAGSVEGGYLLSQVYRWVEKEKPVDGWFVWNEESIMRETHMADFELLRARNVLSQMVDSKWNLVWKEEIVRPHGRLFIRLDTDALHRVIVEYTRKKGEA